MQIVFHDLDPDFVITKRISSGELLIRPGQVKGKYPTEKKGDQPLYGYVGSLEIHPEMVLGFRFSINPQNTPGHIAYMPATMIREHSRGYGCQPVLVTIAAQKSIETIEAEHGTRRPAVVRPGDRCLLRWRVVPFADAEAGVAVLVQHGWYASLVLRLTPVVTGKPLANSVMLAIPTE